MYMDKHGATSVFSAFQTIVQEKLPVNLTCAMGFVENFISDKAYRPLDIIKSRKGLTVEIGNTDAEGRLVLADCMNWVQEKFKVETLLEESTLTGAIIVALGHERAGFFTNDKALSKALRKAGEHANELVWEMPVTDYHLKLITPKHCDLTNSPMLSQAGAGQAAAFLKLFVEEGVNWAHIDIAGPTIVGGHATGYGARLLVEYIHEVASPILQH
jgi:leucyl aminopeptidase